MTDVCDFCSAPDPRWVYPADDIGVAAGTKGEANVGHAEKLKLVWGSLGSWTACDACAGLVEAGDAEALTAQAVKKHTDIPPDVYAALRKHLGELYQVFLDHRRPRFDLAALREHCTHPPELVEPAVNPDSPVKGPGVYCGLCGEKLDDIHLEEETNA